jgi:hypothetical protein
MTYEIHLDKMDAVGQIDMQQPYFKDQSEYETAREDAKGKLILVGTVRHMDSAEGKGIASPQFDPEKLNDAIDGLLGILCTAIAEREKGRFSTQIIEQTKL